MRQGKEPERRETKNRGWTFDGSIDEQLDIVRYINMRSESIAVGDGDGRRRKGKRKKVREREGGRASEQGKDRYTASERLSLIDKLSHCSGNPPINSLARRGTHSYTHIHTQEPAR